MLSYEQAKALVERQYKDYKVIVGFECKGDYYFQISPKKIPSGELPFIEFHVVDSESGAVSGYRSIMDLMHDSEFEQKYNQAVNPSDRNIEHHGIKGQQWGVRNGPPYPLDNSTHNKVTKKKTDVVNKGLSDVDPELLALGAKAAVGASIAIAAWIAKAVQHRRQHKKMTDKVHLESDLLKEKNIADLSKYFADGNPPKMIKGSHTIEQDMAKVNPLHDVNIPETDNNCLLCSMTYDLRRRGYDVTALLTSEGLFGYTATKECYKKAKVDAYEDCTSYKAIEQQMLKKYPDNSRGLFFVRYGNPFYGMSGHAMSWEINNGKLMIIDAQRNVKVPINSSDLNGSWPQLAETVRTDHLAINWKKMNNICAEVLDKKDVKHSFDLTTRAVIGMAGIGDILVSELNDDYLEHHGIKGMKWGIRRFQNYDGSYTKKGLERYEYDEKRYHEAKRERDEARTAYKNGTGSKGAVQNANIKLKAAKRQLSAAYDQVKKDKRADEGRKLYESGQRMTSNVIGENIKQIGVAFIGNLFAKKLDNQGKHLQATALCAAGNAFLAASYIRTKLKNRKIAAYYSHSRPDSLKMPKSESKKT